MATQPERGMIMEHKKCTFVVACRDYFGLLHGQTLKDFSAELKALTPKDRQELCAMFPTVGYDILEPPTPTQQSA